MTVHDGLNEHDSYDTISNEKNQLSVLTWYVTVPDIF